MKLRQHQAIWRSALVVLPILNHSPNYLLSERFASHPPQLLCVQWGRAVGGRKRMYTRLGSPRLTGVGCATIRKVRSTIVWLAAQCDATLTRTTRIRISFARLDLQPVPKIRCSSLVSLWRARRRPHLRLSSEELEGRRILAFDFLVTASPTVRSEGVRSRPLAWRLELREG